MVRAWWIACLALGQMGCATVLGIDGDYEDAAGGASGTGANGTGASGGDGTGANGTGANGTGGSGTGGSGTGAGSTGGAATGGGGSGTGGSATGGGGTGGSGCPTAGGEMAELTFCMDKTEVTNVAYSVWLSTNPDTANQPAYCSWNVSFQNQGGPANEPVTDVDWCDALAFCTDHGKRLCGEFGGMGDPTPFGSRNNPNASEWFRVCSSAGNLAYPYGDTYQPEACFGLDHSTSGLQDVGTAPDCHAAGAASEIFDLSGNAGEWTNACEGFIDGNDKCAVRGGDAGDMAVDLRCDDDKDTDRNSTEDDISFRCCADL